jgi:threonine synthase
VRFTSTGDSAAESDLTTALHEGLAPDGGLYHPTFLPPFPPGFLKDLEADPARVGGAVLKHLLADEPRLPSSILEEVAREALEFPIPLRRLGGSWDDVWILELFHGPTLAFKDVGARVMARLLEHLPSRARLSTSRAEGPGGGASSLTVLTATSGDTGGAVAAAFHGIPGTRVVVLFPREGVSPEQRAQFTTLGPATQALGVEGTFDDCQRLAKAAFQDSGIRSRHALTSANSINVGRLLPQIIYYVHAWRQLPFRSPPPVISVPSGNLGNLTAGIMARRMGLPVEGFVAACNVNDTFPRYLATGRIEPRRGTPTISSAMDVGDPSNLPRLQALLGDSPTMRRTIRASSWSDEATRDCIRRVYRETGTILDPHTAVGLLALAASDENEEPAGPRLDTGPRPRILLATAHPAKFRSEVEPLIGESVPLPPSLAHRLGLEERITPIAPTLAALEAALEGD